MDGVLLGAAILIAIGAGVVITWAMLRGWPRAATGLLILSIYLNHYKYDVGPVSIRAEQVVILGLAGFLGLRLLLRGETPRITVPGLYAVGWWLALAFSAFLHAPDFGDTLRHIIRLGLMILGLIVTVNLARRENDWQRLVFLLFLFGILEAGYGVLARVVYAWHFGTISVLGITVHSPLNLGVQITRSLPVPAPYGTLEEGNIFGSTMAALLLLSLALWVHPQAFISRRLITVGIVLTAAGWLLSLTRGAWLAVVLLLPLLWVLYPARAKRRLTHLGVLIVVAPLAVAMLVVLLLFAPASSSVVSRLQTLARLNVDPTFNLRMLRWQLAWEDILMRPFIGWGPGTFEQLHGIQRFNPAWLDSLTIKSMQEAGLIGTLFMYGMWATAVFDGLYAALRVPDYPFRGSVIGLTLGALALFLAYHATDATWLAFMWVWLGTLIARPRGMWVHYAET